MAVIGIYPHRQCQQGHAQSPTEARSHVKMPLKAGQQGHGKRQQKQEQGMPQGVLEHAVHAQHHGHGEHHPLMGALALPGFDPQPHMRQKSQQAQAAEHAQFHLYLQKNIVGMVHRLGNAGHQHLAHLQLVPAHAQPGGRLDHRPNILPNAQAVRTRSAHCLTGITHQLGTHDLVAGQQLTQAEHQQQPQGQGQPHPRHLKALAHQHQQTRQGQDFDVTGA